MSTTNGTTTENAMVLTPRDQQLRSSRDSMEPGARPAAIVPRNFLEAQAMCAALAGAGLVPKSFKGNPADMLLVVMTGLEVGLPPMASLRLYTTWDGVPRLMAEGVRAIILHSPDIEYFEVATCSDTEATWVGKRRGRPEKSATWTIARARQANLTEKPVWKAYPQDMLNARASMQLGRMLAPDVVAGMVALEEARDGDFIDAAFTEAKPQFVAPPIRPDTGHAFTFVAENAAAPQGPPPGVPVIDHAAKPVEKRGPGRPPKDKPADPTPPQPSNAGSSAPATSSANSPSPSAASTVAESPPSKLDAAVREVEQKLAASVRGGPTAPIDEAPERPTPLGSGSGPTPSAESAAASTAATTSGVAPAGGDDFGSEDPVDAAPKQPTMADFMVWVAGCKTQRDLAAGLGQWRAWSKYMCDVMKDDTFKKTGANTIAMQDAYSKRKGEVPA